MRITIAGASGFIGKNLIKQLQSNFHIKALSRTERVSEDQIEWVQADLFSFQSTANALADTDIAIYLVHSMLPSSRLFQGNFQDTDLLLADNFAKACVKNNVKHIIYLGGLVPIKGESKHLSSRKEVEEVFELTNIPVTILRAGMVVGENGSSFEILRNLVFNLPCMLLPKWTKSTTQAIYIDDLVNVIKEAIKNESLQNKTLDVVNGERINYSDFIYQSAEYFNKKRFFLSVPINYTSFSKLWVKIFGEADYELVSPLIDSLTCELPSPETPEEIKHLISKNSFRDMLATLRKEKITTKKSKTKKTVNNVRSIQRLKNPSKLNEFELSQEYIKWLPKYLRFIIQAKVIDKKVSFDFLGVPLLKLEKIRDTVVLDRVKFHIVGGVLVARTDTGWLEFRLVADGKFTLVSINEFFPSLPWYIYTYTQALFHAKVMSAFGEHLSKLNLKT